MAPVHARTGDLCKPGTCGGIQASVLFRAQERALEPFHCSSNHVRPLSDLPPRLPSTEPSLNPDTSGHPRLGALAQQVEAGQGVNL